MRLYLDDKYAMDLPLLKARTLQCGQSLTDVDIAALAEEETARKAYDRALRFLAYRARSREEVRRYLAKKGTPEPLVVSVIEQLERRGYVDDVAFADYWLAERQRSKPMAPRALRYELRGKGVDDDIISDLLSQFDEDDAAYRAAQAKSPRFRGRTRDAFRDKVSGMLRRRGFGSETINDVVLRLQKELEESEPGYFRADELE